eukprot:IDg13454t1
MCVSPQRLALCKETQCEFCIPEELHRSIPSNYLSLNSIQASAMQSAKSLSSVLCKAVSAIRTSECFTQHHTVFLTHPPFQTFENMQYLEASQDETDESGQGVVFGQKIGGSGAIFSGEDASHSKDNVHQSQLPELQRIAPFPMLSQLRTPMNMQLPTIFPGITESPGNAPRAKQSPPNKQKIRIQYIEDSRKRQTESRAITNLHAFIFGVLVSIHKSSCKMTGSMIAFFVFNPSNGWYHEFCTHDPAVILNEYAKFKGPSERRRDKQFFEKLESTDKVSHSVPAAIKLRENSLSQNFEMVFLYQMHNMDGNPFVSIGYQCNGHSPSSQRSRLSLSTDSIALSSEGISPLVMNNAAGENLLNKMGHNDGGHFNASEQPFDSLEGISLPCQVPHIDLPIVRRKRCLSEVEGDIGRNDKCVKSRRG